MRQQNMPDLRHDVTDRELKIFDRERRPSSLIGAKEGMRRSFGPIKGKEEGGAAKYNGTRQRSIIACGVRKFANEFAERAKMWP